MQYDEEDLAHLAKKKEVSQCCISQQQVAGKTLQSLHDVPAGLLACKGGYPSSTCAGWLSCHASTLHAQQPALLLMLPVHRAPGLLAAASPASSCTAPGHLDKTMQQCQCMQLLRMPATLAVVITMLALDKLYHVLLQEEKALKALKEKAKAGSVGGAGLKKSGKK